MPTDIHFAGESVRVEVDEGPGQVLEAFTSAQGLPFRLTGRGGAGEVYINPTMVAYWSASDPIPEPEPPVEAPPPTTERRAVTDLWGDPLGSKRRR